MRRQPCPRQNTVGERDVLVGIRGALFEDDRLRGHAVRDRDRLHHLGFTQREHEARRNDQPRRHAFVDTATPLSRSRSWTPPPARPDSPTPPANTTMASAGRGGSDDAKRLGEPPHQRGSGRSARYTTSSGRGDLGGTRLGRAVQADATDLPSPWSSRAWRCVSSASISADIFSSRRSQLFDSATSMRRDTSDGGGTCDTDRSWSPRRRRRRPIRQCARCRRARR